MLVDVFQSTDYFCFSRIRPMPGAQVEQRTEKEALEASGCKLAKSQRTGRNGELSTEEIQKKVLDSSRCAWPMARLARLAPAPARHALAVRFSDCC